MPSYHVTRTPGGGYSVDETDTAGLVAGTVGSAVGLAIGGAWAVAARAASRASDRRADAAFSAIQKAIDGSDWSLAYQTAVEFTRSFPSETSAWDALVFTATGLDLPLADRLQVANLAEAHGVEQGRVACLRARAYLDSGDIALALREANALVGLDGTYRVQGYVFRAMALIGLGDLDHALSDASTAVSLAPDAETYRTRAEVFWVSGSLAQAVTDYTFAIRLQPTDARSLDQRASVYEAQGQLEAAEADRQAASELRRAAPKPHLGLWAAAAEADRQAASELRRAAPKPHPSGELGRWRVGTSSNRTLKAGSVVALSYSAGYRSVIGPDFTWHSNDSALTATAEAGMLRVVDSKDNFTIEPLDGQDLVKAADALQQA
jgi:tetratricopeptide (TPR) repeat protein